MPRLRLGQTIIFLLICSVGGYLRFTHLEQRYYWHDEAHTSLLLSGYHRYEVRDALANKPLPFTALQKYQRLNDDRSVFYTIGGSLLTEPQLGPLYFALVRLWAGQMGDTITGTRSFSALCGTLMLPAMAWLCWELFAWPGAGLIAAALVAVSPMHVLYAQEARMYALHALLILISSAALLRALRGGSAPMWWAYTLAVTAGLYTHFLFALVAAGHGLYVLLVAGRRSPALRRTALALGVAAVLLLPWLVNLWSRRHVIVQMIGWQADPMPLAEWTRATLVNLSTVFIDVRFFMHSLLSLWTVPFALLVAYAGWVLVRSTARHVWLFVVVLALSTAAALALPDLLLGGARFATVRYPMAVYLAAEIALAYLFWVRMTTGPHRVAWRVAFGALIIAGVVSCTRLGRPVPAWQAFSSRYHEEVAAEIERAERPLVVSDNLGELMSLSYIVDSRVSVMIVPYRNLVALPAGFTDVFVLQPYAPLLARLEQQPEWDIQLVNPPGRLWRVRRR